MLQCVLHPLLPVIFGPRGSHVLIRDRSLNFTEAPAQGAHLVEEGRVVCRALCVPSLRLVLYDYTHISSVA